MVRQPAEEAGLYVAETPITVSSIVSRIERLPYSAWHVKLRLIVGIALFFDAVDNTSISTILPVIGPLWHVPPSKIGMIISASYVGNALGAFLCGWLAEKYGRMRVMVFTIAVYSVMSFLCALAWNYPSLLVFRSIQGFGLGGELPIAAAFVNEWSKTKGRGKFYLTYNVIYVLGAWAGALVGTWIVPSFGWRWMFVIGAVPAALAAVLRRYVPESPRWLAIKGRTAEADQILSKVEDEISKKGTIPLPPIVPIPVATHQHTTRMAELFRDIYLRRTLVLWTVSFAGAFLNLGITAWMPTLYRTVFKLPLQVALMYGMFTMAVVVVSNAASAYLVDWTGRRLWYACSFLVGAIPYFCIAYSRPANAQTVLAHILIATLFLASPMGVTMLYMVEVYPTRIRALGSSVSRVVQACATIISPMLIGFIVQEQGLFPVFSIFGIVSLATGVVVAVFIVETRGRILEDIAP